MTHQELQLEEQWDEIASRIGFDEKGVKLQDAIRKFVALKITKELEEVKREIDAKLEHRAYAEPDLCEKCTILSLINHRLNKEK
jgi:hypothetical protein